MKTGQKQPVPVPEKQAVIFHQEELITATAIRRRHTTDQKKLRIPPAMQGEIRSRVFREIFWVPSASLCTCYAFLAFVLSLHVTAPGVLVITSLLPRYA